MLREKMRDSTVTLSDSEAKRDIMSLLVRARKADVDIKTDGYAMSDEAMMDQVVRFPYSTLKKYLFISNLLPQLTFLGAGHETTASGLAWVNFCLGDYHIAGRLISSCPQTLWLLAKDPESQQKLRAEVTPAFAENPRPGYRVLKDLQWLDCVV